MQWFDNVVATFWTHFGHRSETHHFMNRLLAVPISFILLICCFQVGICSCNAVFVCTLPLEIQHCMPKVQLSYGKA